jgi:hypothetical protein
MSRVWMGEPYAGEAVEVVEYELTEKKTHKISDLGIL